jgi:hypothetical protein
MVVRVVRIRTELQWPGVARVVERHQHRGHGGAWRTEEAGIAQVVGFLAAQFGTEQHGLLDGTIERPHEIGLVEDVLALGRVVVGADVGQRAVAGDWAAGVYVLVELVVIGNAGAVAQSQAVAEVVLNQAAQGVDIDPGVAAVRIAEERGAIRFHRQAATVENIERGGHAAVGDAIVLEVLVAQGDRGVVAGVEREGRVDAPALGFCSRPGSFPSPRTWPSRGTRRRH